MQKSFFLSISNTKHLRNLVWHYQPSPSAICFQFAWKKTDKEEGSGPTCGLYIVFSPPAFVHTKLPPRNDLFHAHNQTDEPVRVLRRMFLHAQHSIRACGWLRLANGLQIRTQQALRSKIIFHWLQMLVIDLAIHWQWHHDINLLEEQEHICDTVGAFDVVWIQGLDDESFADNSEVKLSMGKKKDPSPFCILQILYHTLLFYKTQYWMLLFRHSTTVHQCLLAPAGSLVFLWLSVCVCVNQYYIVFDFIPSSFFH